MVTCAGPLVMWAAGLLLAAVPGAPPLAGPGPLLDDSLHHSLLEPVRGVTWAVPASASLAAFDLHAMRAMGVEAVRTGLVEDAGLLTLADSLGLRLYQELALDRLSAARLRDTLAYARRALEGALRVAHRHPSARHFGLARGSDTSDPGACVYFEALTDLVRRTGPPGSRTYYVTVFAESDACADAVDDVLLDARDHPQPADLPARWRVAHPEADPRSVGIGALGTWVREGPGGRRVPHSPEAQARYLEDHLARFFGPPVGSPAGSEPPPGVVFVYRWRDQTTTVPSPAFDLEQPYRLPFGLHAREGAQRPARDVVAGFFTGRQTVFAFPAGRLPSRAVPWVILVGWACIALLGGGYARYPRFRVMIQRYFRAHGFYRESVREGRELLFWPTNLLAVTLMLGAGLAGAVVVDAVRSDAAFVAFVGSMPLPVQRTLVGLMARPGLLVMVLAAVFVLEVTGRIAGMVILSSRHRLRMQPGQAQMLVLWPLWGLLPVLVGAMLLTTLPPEYATPAAALLAAAAFGVMLTGVVRTAFDYAAATRAPSSVCVAVGSASPMLIGLLLAFGLFLRYAAETAFLWHLLVRA